MRNLKTARYAAIVMCLSVALIGAFVSASYAKTAAEIDARVNATMDQFMKEVKGAEEYLKGAKGELVMPGVTKAAFIIGGQYGTGALRVDGNTVNYYSLVSGSLGYQIGAEKYDMVVLFMTDEALKKFERSEGWEGGVDGEITLIDKGAAGSVETLRSQHPIVGFVFDQKGLMAGVSLKGAKFTKIKPDDWKEKP
ncbi:MAG TPA: YSC84-related protein [Thermodesulfovibrionales bacterium]|nr:YSC84-related protein [Thermodesulfovibrionales bacterium]